MYFKFVTLVLAAVLCLGRAHAQSTFGEIRGTVTDATGSVIVGAAVTATNTETGDTRKVVSDSSGNYAVLNIDAGRYEVLIEHAGFQKMRATGINLRAREVARVDAKLEVAGTATEVMVTGVAQVITT